MWCAHCRSDVAAEVSPDHRHVRCANCGSEISESLSGRTQTRTRQARELLERWSRERTVSPADVAAETSNPPAILSWEPRPKTEAVAHSEDTFKPPAPIAAKLEPKESTPAKVDPAAELTKRFRIDAAHQTEELIRPKLAGPKREEEVATTNSEPAKSPAVENATQYRVDAAHALRGPHIAFPATKPEPDKQAKSKWVSLVGQSLAYAGVLGLMAGTCLVILGYFRGPASYAPTGWLITMAGQMLLFLGVITLVSSGMEETTNTVTERIDKLGEKLLRIEEATELLRGPKFSQIATTDHRSAETDVRRAS